MQQPYIESATIISDTFLVNSYMLYVCNLLASNLIMDTQNKHWLMHFVKSSQKGLDEEGLLGTPPHNMT